MRYKQAFTLNVVKSRMTSQSGNLKGSDYFGDAVVRWTDDIKMDLEETWRVEADYLWMKNARGTSMKTVMSLLVQ
jgi:hypothetical protein